MEQQKQMFQPATELQSDAAVLARDGQQEERRSASSLRMLLFLLLGWKRQASPKYTYMPVYAA